MFQTEDLPMAVLFSFPELALLPALMEVVVAAWTECYHIPDPFVSKPLVVQMMCFVNLTVQISVADHAAAFIKFKSLLPDCLPVRMLLDVFVVINQRTIW